MMRILAIMLLVPSLAFANAKVPIKPDPYITPGEADRNATVEMVCTSGYAKSVRNVSDSTKQKAFNLYALNRVRGMYEVDHLISLSLGGTNSIRNLWPQHFYTQPWNAKVKDSLEFFLWRQVCDGKVSLKEAQKAMATDWIAAYCKYYNRKPASCAKYLEGDK